jgi:hypothetical protein
VGVLNCGGASDAAAGCTALDGEAANAVDVGRGEGGGAVVVAVDWNTAPVSRLTSFL